MVASISNLVDRYFLFLDVPALKLSMINRPEKISQLPVKQKIKLSSPYMMHLNTIVMVDYVFITFRLLHIFSML